MTTATPAEVTTFVSHLECSLTGQRYAADRLHNLSDAGRPLLVRYDLDALARSVTKQDITSRPPDIWRYRPFLPLRRRADLVSLHEPMTPLLTCPNLSNRLGTPHLVIKDESRMPTGSFKARGLAMAISMAKALGITKVAIPTAGNAGAAAAAYAARAGMACYVFCPDITPEVNIRESAAQGAHVWQVNGLINDCGRIVGEGKAAMGWFDLSTLKEPYRIEGKKTMGLELAEQYGWDVPDVIFYPTGGGTGLIGMWKAFDELEAIGWIGPKRPRLVAVQATGCAPAVRAFERGDDHYDEPWPDPHTIAPGFRVPMAVGDRLIMQAIRETDGFALAVSDEAMLAARDQIAREDGLLLCLEGGATVAAYKQALEDGRVARDEHAVLFNTASGLKQALPEMHRTLDCTKPVDYGAMTT